MGNRFSHTVACAQWTEWSGTQLLHYRMNWLANDIVFTLCGICTVNWLVREFSHSGTLSQTLWKYTSLTLITAFHRHLKINLFSATELLHWLRVMSSSPSTFYLINFCLSLLDFFLAAVKITPRWAWLGHVYSMDSGCRALYKSTVTIITKNWMVSGIVLTIHDVRLHHFHT